MALVLMLCRTASGQTRVVMTGIQVPHTAYNDLITKVAEEAGRIFNNPENRRTETATLLKDLDRLIPMMQANAQAVPPLQAQIRLYCQMRLALGETNAAQANQAALARGGRMAALAAENQGAADWLNAGQNPDAQTAAFEKIRSAVQASGEQLPLSFWWRLWDYRPAAAETIGVRLLDYLRQYVNDPQGLRFYNIVGRQVKRMQFDGKPMAVEGTLVSGAHFSTVAWKGQVVLIAGWAPCFPKSALVLQSDQNLLAKYHSQGLEVLGIGYGRNAGDVNTVLAGNRQLAFPELCDLSHPDIAEYCGGMTTFGLAGETLGPTRLIDRKGIMHYLDEANANEKVEGEIVKFLAEAP